MSNKRGKPAAIVLALALVAGFAACGESGAKRSVDARTESLSFFAEDAPVVALVRPDPPADLIELNRVARGLPAWGKLREMIVTRLHDAGLDRARLRRLIRPEEKLEGIEAAALALGAVAPDDLAAGRSLLVLATDQSELLARYLRKSAAAGRLTRVDTLDGAALYRGPDNAFAVRDGVLVAASTVSEARFAIRRRDGDSDQQLDDGAVGSLFAGLEQTGPLLVYANLGQVRNADPGLQRLTEQAPWTDTLGPTAASARVEDGVLKIEDYSKSSGDLSSADLPIGSEPSPFQINAASVDSLMPPGPLHDLLAGLAPISGEATATSDEVRLHVTLGG